MYISNTTSKLIHQFSTRVTRGSGAVPSDSIAMRYVIPVLWISFLIMEQMSQNQKRRVWFVPFARWRHKRSLPSPTTFCKILGPSYLWNGWSYTLKFGMQINHVYVHGKVKLRVSKTNKRCDRGENTSFLAPSNEQRVMHRNVCEQTVVALNKNHWITVSQGIQKLQAKTSVGTTVVGPPCISQQSDLTAALRQFIGY